MIFTHPNLVVLVLTTCRLIVIRQKPLFTFSSLSFQPLFHQILGFIGDCNRPSFTSEEVVVCNNRYMCKNKYVSKKFNPRLGLGTCHPASGSEPALNVVLPVDSLDVAVSSISLHELRSTGFTSTTYLLFLSPNVLKCTTAPMPTRIGPLLLISFEETELSNQLTPRPHLHIFHTSNV